MTKFDPEYLRSLEHMQAPDPRWSAFGHIEQNGVELISLERYAKPIQKINLNDEVPESVVVHFETAKNLALFAWHVYRFVPVAELHAFISVEFALKEKTGNKKAPFKKLLQCAINKGWLTNEKFSQWQRVTERRALQHQDNVEMAKVLGTKLPEEPQCWDYLTVLMENIPFFRNTYAHGSTCISPWPYKALEDSAEIINQLYPLAQVNE